MHKCVLKIKRCLYSRKQSYSLRHDLISRLFCSTFFSYFAQTANLYIWHGPCHWTATHKVLSVYFSSMFRPNIMKIIQFHVLWFLIQPHTQIPSARQTYITGNAEHFVQAFQLIHTGAFLRTQPWQPPLAHLTLSYCLHYSTSGCLDRL